MKNKTYILNTFLALVLGIYLLIAIFVRTFCPAIILPKASVPNLVLLSLIALVLDHYLAPDAKRCYICIPVLSAVAFGLLGCLLCLRAGSTEACLGRVHRLYRDHLAVYHHSGPALLRPRGKGFCFLQCSEPVYGGTVLYGYVPVKIPPLAFFGEPGAFLRERNKVMQTDKRAG